MEAEHPNQLDASTLQADAAQSLADLKSGLWAFWNERVNISLLTVGQYKYPDLSGLFY